MSCVNYPSRSCYGRTSQTMLNGVSAARRNRVYPASLASRWMAVSPACAPSEQPPSRNSALGTHRNVENEQ
jgi:hypothetical protein